MAISRKSIFITVGALIVAGIASAHLFLPPFFVQFGKHYYAGTGLANAGWYYCEGSFEDCEPHEETFIAAISRDPYLKNWWPIRPEFIRLDESYD